ncbi:hypothetical protein BGZ49_003738, partial [Haplosporangium sp. Z 27]
LSMNSTTQSTIECPDCTGTFSSIKQMKDHSKQYHTEICDISYIALDGTQQHQLVRTNGVFECPFCSTTVETLNGIKYHVNSVPHESDGSLTPTNSTPLESSESLGSADGEVAPHDSLMSASCERTSHEFPGLSIAKAAPLKRGYEELVLTAFEKLKDTHKEKKRALFTAEDSELRPLTLRSDLGTDQVVLVHGSKCKEFSTGTRFVVIDEPVQSPTISRTTNCSNCSPVPSAGLESLIISSPYTSQLVKMKFVELTSDVCKILNKDWLLCPELKHACTQIFAGCILQQTVSGHAILVNCVETYGRKQQIDAHRERTNLTKDKAPQSSIPPFGETRYKDVWPTTMSQDGTKLVIGTHSFNALITSSIRLDMKEPPSIGAVTSSFLLRDPQSSSNTKIFLNCNSLNEALRIVKEKDIFYRSEENVLEQLRQVRSKFDEPTTYNLCRASSEIAKDCTMQPFSVFTLVGSDSMEAGYGRAAAKIFNVIATNVLSGVKEPRLEHNVVEKSMEPCTKEEGKIYETLLELDALFKDQNSILIFGNKNLNRVLMKLAPQLSSYISHANKTPAAFIEFRFSSNV